MAMSKAVGSTSHIVEPRLIRRTIYDDNTTPCVAVIKATRHFDDYLHQLRAWGAQREYELPKRTLKSGITTVDVTLTDKEVMYLWPERFTLRLRMARASWYDILRVPTVPAIAWLITEAMRRCQVSTAPLERLLAFLGLTPQAAMAQVLLTVCKLLCTFARSDSQFRRGFTFGFIAAALEWVSRRKAEWRVRLKIESQAFSIACSQKTLAMQETVTEKAAATPIVTQVATQVRKLHEKVETNVRERYIAVCVFVTSAWAGNRVTVVGQTECVEDAESSMIAPENPMESVGDIGVAKRILKSRNCTAPTNELRSSVRVTAKSPEQLHHEMQKGEERDIPGHDYIKETYSAVVIGPELCNISAGLTGDRHDEAHGLTRHLKVLVSPITGEVISRELSQDAAARMNKATDIICDILKATAREHAADILQWSLPLKWGASRERYHSRLVGIGRTIKKPFLRGFVKLNEIGLPLNKLARLVGSMGMDICAKDAPGIACVENLFKRFMPHLVIKGLRQEDIEQRLKSFSDRGSRLKQQIISIDMSAMDSSWTVDDRSRVRRCMVAVQDEIIEFLEADFQPDLVTQCAEAKEDVRWQLKYHNVRMAPRDAILFSGERGTSIANRLLMLIIFSAELLRLYSDGEQRIKNMFFCPPECFLHGQEERNPGMVEVPPCKVKQEYFPDDPSFDCCTGDGDDCAMLLPFGAYRTKEEMMLAWEEYGKLVDPCSHWAEASDIELLSLMCISTGKENKAYFIPKLKKNFQRILAFSLHIPPGRMFAEGTQTYVPTAKDYMRVATELWLRSFRLRHSMVSRQACRALFVYAFQRAGRGAVTLYSDDQHRLGREDGDQLLVDCLGDVLNNVSADVSPYAMVKAAHFADFYNMKPGDVKAEKEEWVKAEQTWASLELTDELCASIDTLLTSFPVGERVADALGFRQEAIAILKRQLVKHDNDVPDMSDGPRPGSRLVESRDDAFIRQEREMEVDKNFANAIGREMSFMPRCEVVELSTEWSRHVKYPVEHNRHSHKCKGCGCVFEHAHKQGSNPHDHFGLCPNVMCLHHFSKKDWMTCTNVDVISLGKYADLDYEEKPGNIEDLPQSFSLAHCVSQDMHMGKGIAVWFKENFGHVDKLKKQNVKIGDVAFLDSDFDGTGVEYDEKLNPKSRRYICYMVTKREYGDKPTMENLEKTIKRLQRFVSNRGIKALGIPKLACGLDGKQWEEIRPLIVETFRDDNIKIVVMKGDGQKASGSSTRARALPSFEVKAPRAELGVEGPPQQEANRHEHSCQMCGTNYSHSHPHVQGVEHVQKKGSCPNKECKFHSADGVAKTRAEVIGRHIVAPAVEGVDTSSDHAELRQLHGSSPTDGYGTPDNKGSSRMGEDTREGAPGLSPGRAMTEEGASAPTKGGKKGKGKGEASKGKSNARSSNPTGVPSHAKLIEGQDARESEGTSSAAMSSNIRAPAPKAKPEAMDAEDFARARSESLRGPPAPAAKPKAIDAEDLARLRSEHLRWRKEAQQARNSGRHHPEGDVIFQPQASPPPPEEYTHLRLRLR
jgi:O-acetyl-ADP-ribose deacetylase (regulator of RNase III)